MGLGSILEYIAPRIIWQRRIRTWKIDTGEPEARFLPLLVDRRRKAIDIGAAAGTYTASMIPLAAHVIAVEPIPARAQALRQQFARARCVTVHEVALSDRTGEAVLRVPADLFWRSTLEVRNRLEGQTNVHQIAVKIATLDSLELQRVGFIKIDVEGHELAVLNGAAKTLVSERPNILIELEERHCPGTVSSVRRFLQELGYEGHFLFHGQVSPITDFREALHQNPEQLQESGRAEYVCNFMFIPNERATFLAKRLRQATP